MQRETLCRFFVTLTHDRRRKYTQALWRRSRRNGATLSIQPNTITGLIGPNGAGKTTLFNVIAGLYQPTSGKVTLNGEDITGLKPHELFHKGVLRTFQLAHEFATLTVRDNLMMVPPNQAGRAF